MDSLKQKKPVKYSIIIPSRNGGEYLKGCIQTILTQNFNDIELIISDDHSTDQTAIYLNSIKHSCVRIICPPSGLSMTEHWEWALAHASGTWLIFVGQDDGLQPYFFKLAEKLTLLAESKKIRAIMSERAYFFWKGCEFVYGDIAIKYKATNRFKILDSRLEITKALFGIQTYFELPEMYTTSLFHRDLINEAKERQNGYVLRAHPQDANLAAIACSLEKKYIKSFIPLGWVGSSPKSAGMAVSSIGVEGGDQNDRKALDDLKNEYQKKVSRSKLAYHPLAGDFLLGSLVVYFWQALLQTPALRSPWKTKIFRSRFFRALIIASASRELNGQNRNNHALLDDFRKINKCNSVEIVFAQLLIASIRLSIFILSLPEKLLNRIDISSKQRRVEISKKRSEAPNMDIVMASNEVAQLMENSKEIFKL